MQHRIRSMLALGTLAAIAACAEGPTSPAKTDGTPILSKRGDAGTSVTASVTAAGFNEVRSDYDWALQKRVRVIMGQDMAAEPSTSETSLVPGEGKWIEYSFIATRTPKPAVHASGARGQVCVANAGAGPTRDLAITEVLRALNSAGQYVDVASRSVDVSAKAVLAPGESYCYSYEQAFAGSADGTYSIAPRVTITNYTGHAGSAYGPGAGSGAVAARFSVPSSTAAVETNASAVLTEGVNQACANIFPSVICTGSEGFKPQTFTQTTTYEPMNTIDGYNFHVCGEDLPFTNTATLTESGPYAPGAKPKTHTSSATLVFHTGTCAPKPTNPGCTYTQGYWKNHAWPLHPIWKPTTLANWPDINDWRFFDSGIEWQDVLNVSPKGDAYYILAHQYIAAILNQQNGAYVPDDVRNALVYAYNYFSMSPSDRAAVSRDTLIATASLLDNYNNGRLGVPHCG